MSLNEATPKSTDWIAKPNHSMWISRISVRRTVSTFALLVAVGYLCFLSVFLFDRASVIEFVGSLKLVPPDRVAAKAGNILFGMTFISIVWLAIFAFEYLLARRFDKPVFHSLLTCHRLEEKDPVWFTPLSLVLSLLGVLTVVAFFLHAKLGMIWLFLEDGPVEYGTAFGFLLAGLAFLTYTFRFSKSAPNDLPYRRGLMVVFALIGMACILVSVEEISWGQRVLGIQTPEALAAINTQKELNLHNLFTDNFNEAYFIIGCVFMVINLVGIYLRVSLADQFWARFMPHPMHLILAGLVTSFSFHLEANELVEPLAVLYLGLYTVQVGLVLRDQHPNTVTSSDV